MTGRVLYSLSVSLDGFAATADGSIDWVIVDEELHQAFNDESRETPVFVHGRHMHELLHDYWTGALDDPDIGPVEREFAEIYRDARKIVCSRTLDAVAPGCELVRDDAVGTVARLRDEGLSVGVGGPTLAASLLRAGLLDEVTAHVNPVVLGGGLPFLPPLPTTMGLRLVGERRFGSGVVSLRYAVVRQD
jgi:dihydrofolate reductase